MALERLASDPEGLLELRILGGGTDGSYCPSCRGVWGFSRFLVSSCCYGKSMPGGTDIPLVGSVVLAGPGAPGGGVEVP